MSMSRMTCASSMPRTQEAVTTSQPDDRLHPIAGDVHPADDPRAVEGPIGRAIAVVEVGPAMQGRIIETDMRDRFIG